MYASAANHASARAEFWFRSGVTDYTQGRESLAPVLSMTGDESALAAYLGGRRSASREQSAQRAVYRETAGRC